MGKVKILVIIDTQNDFIDGSLRNEEAIKVVPNIVKKINDFKGDYIFVTRDSHTQDYLNTNEGKILPVEHCICGTDGWMINSEVAKALHKKDLQEECLVLYFDKPTFGSFELMNAFSKYIGKNEGEIEFVGFCTDICVVSNVLITKANCYDNAVITVDASCCAGVTPESHKAALLTMKMCQINVINE